MQYLHLTEHKTIVTGSAKTIASNKSLALAENQSTSPPQSAVLSFANPVAVPFESIEMKPDTTRATMASPYFEDTFGQAKS